MLQRSQLPATPSAATLPAGTDPGHASLGLAQAPGAVGGERNRSAAKGALEGAVQRLEEVVDQETQALRNRVAIDLNDFNDRKNHALLELTRALRQLQGRGNDTALLTQLGSLRSKLEINRAVLKMHLEAVREISTALSDAIRDADSDGTYSQAIRTAARRQ